MALCTSASQHKYETFILRRPDMQESPGLLHDAQLVPKGLTEAQAAALETPGALIQYNDYKSHNTASDVVEIIAPLGGCREAWTGLVGRPVEKDRHGAIKPYKKADVYEFLLPSDSCTAVPLLQVCCVPVQVSTSACLLGTLPRVTLSEIVRSLHMY